MLNVKHTNMAEVMKEWDFRPVLPIKYYYGVIFIRCNAKGEVKWHKAPLYHIDELKGRKIVIH